MKCNNCGAEYKIRLDRPGNLGERPVCCPFCRQELGVVLFIAIEAERRE